MWLSTKSLVAVGLLSALGLKQRATAVELSGFTKDLFTESMDFLDKIYDPAAGYLHFFYYPLAAGKHETRSSVWYAAGLLQRNIGDDVAHATKIIKNVIRDQKKIPEEQWYGDYTVYPEEPTVGTAAYPKSIYNTWDPNWRGFIGTTLIVIYEEFRHLLSSDVQDLILESMYNNTIGDSYRVGGVDDDNLYPSYSNPAIMRAIATGWTGRTLNDSNMTAAGEMYAQEILDLFDRNGTLSEFNSPTYAGVSIYSLTLWAKYMPSDSSLMGQHGGRMIKVIWESIAAMYNANLRNVAGPWDRTYGFDMNQYVAIINIYIWSLVGKDRAPGISQTWSMAHADDFEYAPLISVLAPFHDALVPSDVVEKLSVFPGEHMYETAAFSPPHDSVPRNITTWLSANLTIGAESYDEDTLGGPREDPSQWSTAVVQWARNDGSVGYAVLHGTEEALNVDVSPGHLSLSYPRGNSTSIFTFLVSSNPLGGKRDISGLDDLEGIQVSVSGSVNPQPGIGFCGLVGGTCSIIHGFEFWNITFVMPGDSSAVPSIELDIKSIIG
ncbi:hypothetical protein CABS01_00595 [Colletotrichum abscissum]|uniref:Uncharacterized protein n=1 Tax=Colletotrichum lupini TaxID=145971 RepID=A0A9Q8SL02_9PEZI|nr:uncharacterized protein CLUP02_04283 [Colletotrichum lupini]XP_060406490.1 uncharacterized protein CABS01_00595 [Colletotrichum abscissum]KAK1525506.1 hypothetical protein CABS01_00595 [Colletotrichum abscissum]UQC78806.1 hypothetical protein CLUP02_04283 [Colletotrichum lupini]